MITINTLTQNKKLSDPEDIIEFFDKICECIPCESELHIKLERKAFYAFVVINTICHWQSDGWCNLLWNFSIAKYIVPAMQAVNLSAIAEAIEQVEQTYPISYTECKDQAELLGLANFIENPRRKRKYIYSERLLAISQEQRQIYSQNFNTKLKILDDLVTPLWDYQAPEQEIWQPVIDFINQHNTH
ncbi:hypothetical protein A9G28_07980 [Gilliamella sp. Fer1-1]|jgi:hypothetical protein|uniref:hypothetical protein n=1 Tax=unclassified Gilliamella TaxID=2685620 RepID=UPI00080EDC36|nr:hypothetical protein [Gilliamella apicola]OCG15350.1 hypothetical protein A9G47_12310 [Gilliamella apicola]OCG38429.1 hypothetical protein A9G29_10890 [Gilliamella apicola]OCG40452.1 hypothetical protein A9G28_07980 [Gilliamella apicola]OCG68536.1 hypothetical protein A9G30_05025 [Gilliamella apicola]